MSDLWSKDKYITSQKYVSGCITEYDIKSANINILRSENLITEETYRTLSNLPKMDREIYIGKLHRERQDIDISKTIINSLEKYRKQLFDLNNLDDSEIVRIARDAVYVHRPYPLKHLSMNDYVVFRPKMVASAMINLNGVLTFTWYNDKNQIEINVIGIGKKEYLHQNGMLSLIANAMYMIDNVDPISALNYVQDFYSKYVSRKLPIDYYRDFNPNSNYTLSYSSLNGKRYYLDNISENNIYDLDISYNLNVIRELYSIIYDMCIL